MREGASTGTNRVLIYVVGVSCQLPAVFGLGTASPAAASFSIPPPSSMAGGADSPVGFFSGWFPLQTISSSFSTTSPLSISISSQQGKIERERQRGIVKLKWRIYRGCLVISHFLADLTNFSLLTWSISQN